MVDEHALEGGVEPSFETGAVARHGTGGGQCGIEETQKRDLIEQAFEP